MKISINQIIMYVIYGFILIWIIFAYNISNNNQLLNLYMPQYILVSLIYIVIMGMIITLLEYIRDNYV